MAEVGPELRVTLRVSDRSQFLRSEGCGIEEFSQTSIAYMRILDLVGTILPSAIEWGGAIVVAVLFTIAFDRVISTAAGFGDGEWLAALPRRDRVRLPSGESELLDASEGLSKLELIVKRKGEAALNVVLRNAVLDLTDVVRIGIAPTLVAALLREASDVAQPLAPRVVRIEG